MIRLIIFLWIALVVTSCDMDGKFKFPMQKNKAFTPIETESLITDRSSWQKPEWVIQKMGDIKGKTIADIGSGTGYFTYRFAIKDANVIAIDIDPEAINLIKIFKENLPELTSEKIETRLAFFDDPKIIENEVDFIFISNTVAYIENLAGYLSKVKNGLKLGGKLVIIDFKMKAENDFVPPTDERISIEDLGAIISEAGYKIIETDIESLAYQYIIIAEL